ncbi:hypothetical protein [Halomonas dongshanensis]|uniref:Carrier domain-containing protein n=1 Tax=Halomonas dongshanensis TaxID=2890835 RepID=A0ABT2EHJ4_9GAMM|nr:hypothetical protein [Halomonas dongshanensis]MCS2611054.1 hypothetical protein [Halomonas dongshanensis]
MSDTLTYQLAQEDVDVILAALRLLQRTLGWDIPDEIQDIGGESLDVVNIDRLCERLNLDGNADDQDERDVLIRRFRAELSRPDWNSDTAANLATALGDAGWPIFTPLSEGWYLDVEDGCYAVAACADGPFQSNAQAVTSIALQFATGSRWHGQVLDSIGMTACGHGMPLMRILGYGPNAIDVVVCNELRPDDCLEIGYRPHPFESATWSVFRRDTSNGEVKWIADQPDQRGALRYCAAKLGVALNDEILKSFSTYFQ